MSSEKLPTAGLILPMLSKIGKLFSVSEEDSTTVQALKQAVWGDLMLRYGNDDLREFLEECTAMDPRFKQYMHTNDQVWGRLKEVTLTHFQESETVSAEEALLGRPQSHPPVITAPAQEA